MSLTSRIFGEEYVTRQECLTRTVTKFDIDAPARVMTQRRCGARWWLRITGSEMVSEQ
jgi:hypothetical protein